MRTTPWILAAAVAVSATACYRDFDFTSDSKADHVVVDDAGSWTDLGTGTVLTTGDATDWPVPGDWNADHVWDMAVVTPSGDWVTKTTLGTISFPPPATLPDYAGHSSLTNLPVPADYDGDGAMDPAWYRESDGTWFIEGLAPVSFGTGPTDLPGLGNDLTMNDYDFPVPADYDGDGTDDLSVFNPVSQVWQVRSSVDGTVSSVTMAGNESLPLPVPADYDGVGHAQRAVYGPNGWFIEGHASPDLFGTAAGAEGESGIPAVADYDGDGKDDLAMVGSISNTWFTKGSVATQSVDLSTQWPLPTGYNLKANLARITLLGFCHDVPDICVPSDL